MFSYRRVSRLLALIGASLVLGLWSTSASAVDVNCANPAPAGSIQAQLNTGQTFIRATGTCNETVFIGQDNVTIRDWPGNPAPVITGGLAVQGATRVFITNLTINGNNLSAGSNVVILEGAYVRFTNVTLEELHNGVALVRHAGAFFVNSTLGPSLVDDGRFGCNPLCALDSSDIRLQGTTVTGNASDPAAGAAVSAVRNSNIVIRGGNTITNNGSLPVLGIFFGSHVRQDILVGRTTDVINGGTAGDAVQAVGLSLADFREATINGNIGAGDHSVIRLGSTSLGGDPSLLVVNGDVNLNRDSGLSVLSPLVTINGDVNCADRESSLAGSFQGGGEIDCSGFDPGSAKGGDDDD